jgi:hypothetical protein
VRPTDSINVDTPVTEAARPLEIIDATEVFEASRGVADPRL